MPSDPTRNWPGIALWILTGLLALLFAVSAITKLIGTDLQYGYYASLGAPVWLMYWDGAVEAIGVVALLIPRVSGLGALWLAVEMAVWVVLLGFGGLLFPLTIVPIVPIVLAVLFAFIAYRRRDAVTWALGTLRRAPPAA